ncbi:MAG: hypothetical protein QOE06_654 [Thermoleophilaceae bacterium]|jgi:hypothetical protein|nr:hypothetical protein [Thermoleophilaceae bacterium]
MNQIPQPNQAAAERIAARRSRINRIRSRIAAGAVAVFIAAFAGLLVQLNSGQDPVLSKKSSAATTSSTAKPAASTPVTSTPATSTAPSQPAPVATHQS